MDKQKLEEEKMKLVGQYNALQEKIDEYGLVDLSCDGGTFKDLSNKKYLLELKIKEINFLISQCK